MKTKIFVTLLLIMVIGGISAKAQTLIPFSGNNAVACGTNTSLCTHAGCGNTYSINASGYTVLNASGTAVINIAGSYATESGYDYVRIYSGAGTGGTLLMTYQGSGTLNYTGTAGQTLTVQFTSDGSVNYAGLNATVTYSGPCTSEMLVPTTGSNSYSVCSGHLYDNGGSTGAYATYSDGYTVLYPGTPGNVIRLTGNYYTEAGYDHVYIYNGVGTAGTLLLDGSASALTSIGTITSTDPTGALTVRFTSDGSIQNSGFDFTISCISNEMTVPYSGSNSYTTCSGTLYDHAGSTGNYTDYANGYSVLYPSIAGNMIQISGTTSGEPCCDYISVYNGVGTGGTLLGTYYMNTAIPILTSTDPTGALTVLFYSDVSVTGTGFAITISCVPPPAPANDNCANAISIGALPYTSSIISNAFATDDSPTSTCDGPYKNIWWTVIGICGTMTANTCTGNTNFDSEIAVFTGACGGMTQVGCNDDNCGLQSSVTWTATAGVTYYISVGSYYSGGSTGNIQLNVTSSPYTASTAPTSITGVSTICNGTSTTLTASGGTDGTGAIYEWFTGSCGGTAAGNGISIIVAPTTTTTYYVRRTGTCNTTACISQTVTVNSLSTPPTSISGTTTICLGTATTLTAVGGSLGTGATAVWYEGSACGPFTQDWVTQPYGTPNTTVNSVISGILNVTSVNNDPMIDMAGLGSFDPNIFKYVSIKYRVLSGTAGNVEIFFYNGSHNYAVGGESATASIISDGAWHVATVNMANDPDYTTGGNILGWRFDWASAAGVNMEIDYIDITTTPSSNTVSPTANTTYYVRYEGQCNTTSCVSTTVTVNAPSATGIVANDYVWSGNTSTEWNTTTNWLTYNGSNFVIPGGPPTTANNVFVRAYGSCASNVPTIATVAGNARNLTIESGKTLTMAGGQTFNVSGNWTNAGTFNAGNGTVNFNGASTQTIASGGAAFYSVNFNNSTAGNSDINVSQPMTINGVSNFNNGILYFTGTGSLTYNNGATSNQGSASSFVNGLITKIGVNAFTFPTGKLSGATPIWAPIAISAPTIASTITGEYFFGSPPNNYNIADMCDPIQLDHASGVEYWQLNRTAGSGAYPSVTLYWKDVARSGITTLADLRVAHYEVCSGPMKWANMGGTGIDDGGGTGHITSTVAFTSYSPITFGTRTNANPLPVSLTSFTGICEDGTAKLHWVTASETNNDYFTIEKSVDADAWQFVTTIPGAGNSNQELTYSANDPMDDDVMYYRLTQTDFDGKFEIFPPISLSCSSLSSDISLYPNPTNGIVTIETSDINLLEIRVIDATGRIISFSGTTRSVDLTNLATGIYMFQIIPETGNPVFKEIIKN